MSFSDQLDDLDQLISSSVESSLREATREVTEAVRSRVESLERETRSSSFEQLRDATVRLDEANGQSELLSRLLEESGRFASRSLLLLTSRHGIRGWAGYGFDDEGGSIEELDLDSHGAFAFLGEVDGCIVLEASSRAELASRLDAPVAQEAVIVPLVLRDALAAVLYADRLEQGDTFDVPALQLLVYSAAHLVEDIPTRERERTPTLVTAGDGGEPLPLWDPERVASVGGAGETREAPVREDSVERIEPTPVSEDEWEVEEEEPVEPRVPGPTEEEGELFEAELPQSEEPELEAEPVPEMEEPAPEAVTETPALEEPEVEALPEPEGPDEDISEDRTVLIERPSDPEAPGAEPGMESTATTEGVAPRRPSPGTTEVVPPSDIDEGPGLAFRDQEKTEPIEARDQEMAAMHEEARRLARLLISEIKLYNEEKVEEGRRNNDLYERLEDDIDRSRRMYEERIDPRVREETDYFRQELVNTLAGGDQEALGREP